MKPLNIYAITFNGVPVSGFMTPILSQAEEYAEDIRFLHPEAEIKIVELFYKEAEERNTTALLPTEKILNAIKI